jgi:hypothetical protein
MRATVKPAKALPRFLLPALAAFACSVAAGARADSPRVPLLPRYVQECGSCHVAYPPGLLPPASWQRLMDNLPRHFGTDASLDAPTATELSRWLGLHAGTTRRFGVAPPQDRITRSGWFQREHDEVPADAWKRAAIKSPANCAACHRQAEQGDFDEHGIRIPR